FRYPGCDHQNPARLRIPGGGGTYPRTRVRPDLSELGIRSTPTRAGMPVLHMPEEPQEPTPESSPTPEPVTNPSWERVQLARHPKRPHSLDYIQRLFTDFRELHGDRFFGDDPAVVGGMGYFESRPVMVIGQQKGRDTKQKLHR